MIVSVCILHNICIVMDDDAIDQIEEDIDEMENNVGGSSIVESGDRRQILFDYLRQNNVI